MTGRYAFRTGMWDSNYESELPLEETTLAEELQALGYKTYMVSGRWYVVGNKLQLNNAQYTRLWHEY